VGEGEREREREMEIERWREREGGREGVHARYTPDTHKVHIRSHARESVFRT
jgi:hypothetical protein